MGFVLARRNLVNCGGMLEPSSFQTDKFPDLSHKPITLPGNSFNVFLACNLFAQGPSQDADFMVKVGLFDHGIRPDGSHQCVFRNQAAMSADQSVQGVKYSSSQGYAMAVARQAPFANVQPEGTEFKGLIQISHNRSTKT